MSQFFSLRFARVIGDCGGKMATRDTNRMPLTKVQIAHLCFRPLVKPGSVNRVVAQIVEGTPEFRHIVISYDAELRDDKQVGANLILGGARGTLKRLTLSILPEKLRQAAVGIGDVSQVLWLWRCWDVLRTLKPPVIFCHDHYKLGAWLRERIDWPSRLILTQHGFAYMGGGQTLVPDGFDVIVYLTRAAYEFCRRHSPMTVPAVEVIPNMVDTDLYYPADDSVRAELRRKHGIASAAPVFTFISRLVPKKGVALLMEAWIEYSRIGAPAELWIAGSPENLHFYLKVKKMSESARASHPVRFLGHLRPEAVGEILKASDYFLFPTLWPEGMGLALFEALSSGLPCVVSRWPVLEECCDGSDVVWVDMPNSRGDWLKAMDEVRLRSPRDAAAREQRHKWVRSRYGKDVVLPKWRALMGRELELSGYR